MLAKDYLDILIKLAIALTIVLISLMSLAIVAKELTIVTTDPLAVIVAAIVGGGLIWIGIQTHKATRYQATQGDRDNIKSNFYLLKKASNELLKDHDRNKMLLQNESEQQLRPHVSIMLDKKGEDTGLFPSLEGREKMRIVKEDAELLDSPEIARYVANLYQELKYLHQLNRSALFELFTNQNNWQEKFDEISQKSWELRTKINYNHAEFYKQYLK